MFRAGCVCDVLSASEGAIVHVVKDSILGHIGAAGNIFPRLFVRQLFSIRIRLGPGEVSPGCFITGIKYPRIVGTVGGVGIDEMKHRICCIFCEVKAEIGCIKCQPLPGTIGYRRVREIEKIRPAKIIFSNEFLGNVRNPCCIVPAIINKPSRITGAHTLRSECAGEISPAFADMVRPPLGVGDNPKCSFSINNDARREGPSRNRVDVDGIVC